MKICLFSIVTYWHGVKGGMEIHGKILCEGLVKRGHEVIVISTKHPDGKDFEERNGISLYYLDNTVFSSKRKGWEAASLEKFIELEQINNFDIICSMSVIIPKELVTIERKTPIIVISEGTGIMMLLSEIKQTFSHRNGFKNLINIFMSFIYYYIFWELSLKKYDAVIAVSNEVAKSTLKWYFVDKRKVYTVYNGVDTRLFFPDQSERKRMRRTLAFSDDEKVLLFFSFITKQKGLHLLIKALPIILKDNKCVKLMIVGAGEYLDEAKLIVEQSGIENYAFFTGHISHKDVSHYINASDIFIMPTLRQEGLPFALIEAMACGKPVIASKIGGISSVVDDGINGFLIPPGDVSTLAEKAIFLLNNKYFTDKLADNARKKVVQNFSYEKMMEETVKVFESAMISKKEQGQ
jgi:glycosyltransferase involved in cell wall biosynthesis